jgi:hypothetical protein
MMKGFKLLAVGCQLSANSGRQNKIRIFTDSRLVIAES